MAITIRDAQLDRDLLQIHQLYLSITQHNPGTINQEEQQITKQYVQECIKNGLARGIVMLAELDGKVVGYLKGFTSPFKSMAHVLGDVTILIAPHLQNKKIGTQLIQALQHRLMNSMQHIFKVELLPHDTNVKSIELYKKLGFFIAYSSYGKILNPDATYGDQVLMEWVNPNFNQTVLQVYQIKLLKMIKPTPKL